MAEDKFQRGRLKTDPSPAMVNYVIRPGLELALKLLRNSLKNMVNLILINF